MAFLFIPPVVHGDRTNYLVRVFLVLFKSNFHFSSMLYTNAISSMLKKNMHLFWMSSGIHCNCLSNNIDLPYAHSKFWNKVKMCYFTTASWGREVTEVRL